MTKIAYNACYGGFALSNKGIMRYAEIKGFKLYAFNRDGVALTNAEAEVTDDYLVHYYTTSDQNKDDYFSAYDLSRTDPALVQTIEELGDEASGPCSNLQIVDIPKGTSYRIDEYDGNESVMTQDNYNWDVA